VRPALWDGGYAFWAVFPGGIASGSSAVEDADGTTIPAGTYIVEGTVPPGYDLLKEEDKNVDFGPEATPSPLLIPAACFGDQHLLPEFLTLFPIPNPSNEPYDPLRRSPLCDRKQVTVRQGQNSAADFFVLTQVPVAGHLTGFILNDFANEFDPNAPTFGEKYSPPFLPVSIRDWTGREFSRVYSDRWGNYNALVPSTYWISAPFPSGVAPNMLTACMNSPGPVPNPDYTPGSLVCSGNRAQSCTIDADCGTDQTCIPASPAFVTDPHFDRRYSQFCYTFQYIPGKTTYLDTPVQPIAAYSGPAQFPVDCEWQDGTPVIWSVYGSQGGPFVPYVNATAIAQQITIVSAGVVQVPNPAYDEVAQPKTIPRDFGFGSGTPPTVTFVPTSGAPVVLPVDAWTADAVTATVPLALKGMIGQLVVTRGDNGKSTEMGLTLYVGPLFDPPGAGNTPVVHHVRPSATGWPDRPIQAAIDAAAPGDLILVAPGTYDENVIMWKPVRLQGWGAGSTLINAAKIPAERLQWWRDTVSSLITAGSFDLLPAQEIGFAQPEPDTFFTEEGPGIIVLSRDVSALPNQNQQRNAGGFVSNPNARIDGFGITGADHGGGIFVNAYANFLQISNNRVIANQGVYGGGIRVGHPLLTVQTDDGLDYQGAQPNMGNGSIVIHHNQVIQNGSTDGAGGGISINHGSGNYRVERNLVCGNFTGGDGAGIGHYGLSDNGSISNNSVLFNEAFNQGLPAAGGGISIAGAPVLLGNASAVTPGSGSVRILDNVIQGNTAGAGDGGGIRLAFVNGRDIEVTAANATRSAWNHIEIYNNMVNDNIAALAGGGISLQDAARVSIVHDTIVNNDGTATAGVAFAPGSPNVSTPQVGGIVARQHSDALTAVIATKTNANVTPHQVFSNPLLYNDIIRNNRSFYFTIDPDAVPTPVFGLSPDVGGGDDPVFWDLSVQGVAGQYMNPRNCILSSNWQDPDSNPWEAGGTSNPYTSMVCSGSRGRTCTSNANCRTCSGNPTIFCTNNTQCASASAGTCLPAGSPQTCVLSNFSEDVEPLFVREYFNGNRGQTIQQPELTTSIAVQPAFDEGGNFITVRFGPLTPVDTSTNPDVLFADEHLVACTSAALGMGGSFSTSNNNPFSPALNLNCSAVNVNNRSPLCLDYDGDDRDYTTRPDIGADESTAACAAIGRIEPSRDIQRFDSNLVPVDSSPPTPGLSAPVDAAPSETDEPDPVEVTPPARPAPKVPATKPFRLKRPRHPQTPVVGSVVQRPEPVRDPNRLKQLPKSAAKTSAKATPKPLAKTDGTKPAVEGEGR
jgi:hypothetical protein